MTRIQRSVTALLGIVALSACGSTDTGNGQQPGADASSPSAEPQAVFLALALEASDNEPDAPNLVVTDADGRAVIIDTARLNIVGIDIVLPTPCEDVLQVMQRRVGGPPQIPAPEANTDMPDDASDQNSTGAAAGVRWSCDSGRLSVEGPWVADLFARTFAPLLDAITLLEGEYTRIDVHVAPASPVHLEASDDPLTDHTLALTGRLSVAGELTAFALALEFTETLRFEVDPPIVLGDVSQTLTLAMDATEWLRNLELTRCAEDDAYDVDSKGILFVAGGANLGCDPAAALRAAVSASAAGMGLAHPGHPAGQPVQR